MLKILWSRTVSIFNHYYTVDDIYSERKSSSLVALTSDHSVLNYIVKLVMDGSCLHRHTTVLPASSCYRLFIYGLNFSFFSTKRGIFNFNRSDLSCQQHTRYSRPHNTVKRDKCPGTTPHLTSVLDH